MKSVRIAGLAGQRRRGRAVFDYGEAFARLDDDARTPYSDDLPLARHNRSDLRAARPVSP